MARFNPPREGDGKMAKIGIVGKMDKMIENGFWDYCFGVLAKPVAPQMGEVDVNSLGVALHPRHETLADGKIGRPKKNKATGTPPTRVMTLNGVEFTCRVAPPGRVGLLASLYAKSEASEVSAVDGLGRMIDEVA